eukprot:COSAG01_NODE_24931_length_761_cov_1.077039_2_plen_154_part_00
MVAGTAIDSFTRRNRAHIFCVLLGNTRARHGSEMGQGGTRAHHYLLVATQVSDMQTRILSQILMLRGAELPSDVSIPHPRAIDALLSLRRGKIIILIGKQPDELHLALSVSSNTCGGVDCACSFCGQLRTTTSRWRSAASGSHTTMHWKLQLY